MNIAELIKQFPADLSQLTGEQLSRAMHACRKIEMANDPDSDEWKAAAKFLDALTIENARRLFPNDPPPKGGAHVRRRTT